MKAFYNEHDPHAAEWTRELMKDGLISDGDVDERSIEDIAPDDFRGYRRLHWFGGIAVWDYALRLAGFDPDREVWTASCPCQSFSQAGKGKGFDDERHLWPALFWLISQCRPELCFGEQVASPDGFAWLDLVCADLEGVGYTVGALVAPAAGFGAPHARHRIYWVAKRRESGDGQADGASARRGERGAGEAGASGGDEQQPERLRAADGTTENRLAVSDGHVVGQRRALAGGRAAGGGAEPRAGLGFGGSTDDVGDPANVGHERRWRAWRGRGGPADDGADDACRTCCGTGLVFTRIGDAQRRQCPACLFGVARAAAVTQGDSGSTGLEGLGGDVNGGTERSGEAGSVAPAGPTNGFWANADWLPCTDGKQRPVEPGTLPMADGSAGELGLVRLASRPDRPHEERVIYAPLIQKGKARAMRLRGYGNAVVAQQAAAFIRAFLEIERGQKNG